MIYSVPELFFNGSPSTGRTERRSRHPKNKGGDGDETFSIIDRPHKQKMRKKTNTR